MRLHRVGKANCSQTPTCRNQTDIGLSEASSGVPCQPGLSVVTAVARVPAIAYVPSWPKNFQMLKVKQKKKKKERKKEKEKQEASFKSE